MNSSLFENLALASRNQRSERRLYTNQRRSRVTYGGQDRFGTTPLQLTPRDQPEFRDGTQLTQLAAAPPLSQHIKLAMYLVLSRRMQSIHAATFSGLRIGPLQIAHLLGEPFVELQLFAQQVAGDYAFICVAGYGVLGISDPIRSFTIAAVSNSRGHSPGRASETWRQR